MNFDESFAKLIDPRQAYGLLIDQMSTTIRAFRDLPGFHVYVSAKQEAIKDDQTGIVLNGPSMPGTKLGPALPYHFDEGFHLDIGRDQVTQKDYRFLRTQPDFQNDAKDRSGKLDAIEYPDLGNIIRKITATS